MLSLQERADELLAKAKAQGLRWYPSEDRALERHTYIMGYLDGRTAQINETAAEELGETLEDKWQADAAIAGSYRDDSR